MTDPAAPEGARVLRKPPDGKRWSRVHHEAAKGGCGADITESCAGFVLNLPTGSDARGNLFFNQQVVRVVPMVCPACGTPLFHEADPDAPRIPQIAVPTGLRIPGVRQ